MDIGILPGWRVGEMLIMYSKQCIGKNFDHKTLLLADGKVLAIRTLTFNVWMNDDTKIPKTNHESLMRYGATFFLTTKAQIVDMQCCQMRICLFDYSNATCQSLPSLGTPFLSSPLSVTRSVHLWSKPLKAGKSTNPICLYFISYRFGHCEKDGPRQDCQDGCSKHS
mgnify:CR=1 FL=1